MSALAFVGTTLSYGGDPVVRDVSLEVRAGELVGVVGPNGAGKTTLLRGVGGEARIEAGRVEIGGEPVGSLGARELARRVGVLPQSVTAESQFTAREFVAMGRHARRPRFGAERPQDRGVVEEALVRTDTLSLAEEPVTTLSGGDLQRLALAQALSQEPKVLLLDEPTSHLDVNHRLQILDLCRDLADGGMAVLGVFHDLDLAARYADRIAVLSEGRIVEDGTPRSVLRADVIGDVFGVRAVVGTDAATGAVSVTPILRDEDVVSAGRGRVLVVGGSGTGARLMRRLLLDGFDVALAGVAEGDTDYDVAEVLGIERVELPPFGQMDQAAETAVRGLAGRCDAVVVARTPFGRANVSNLRAAATAGKPLVLVGTMEGRDFTGGEATALWSGAVEAGAVVVEAEEDAVPGIEGVLPA